MMLDDLPKFFCESTILTESDLELLRQIERYPTDDEIDAMRVEPEVQELLNAFIGDEHTRSIHLQLKARSFLNTGEIMKAWLVLLL